MANGAAGYEYLGIPKELADVLYRAVQDVQLSLAGRETTPWAQLTSVAISRCVLHYASLHQRLRTDDVCPEIACSEVFHEFSEQLLRDTTAAEWGVPAFMVPVVAGTVAACGRMVVDRMNRPT
ncbi:hypothetical protein AWB82_07186 [Caballeronia glebae]|uniref:Uncharacterized protein n=1 Tax=Caballeronia glebae TaxID=1777143 RepID=A0A158DWK0_9BURK|nr:hypothetical protein AWB82_07186 [Caballeronia glebae]